jgi:N-acetyl-gamma-glutamyl-phosphate reductase
MALDSSFGNIRAGIVGSGFTAEELLQTLGRHPSVSIEALDSRQADPAASRTELRDILDHLSLRYEQLSPEAVAERCDVTFLCSDDATNQRYVPALVSSGKRCIDLGGSYRLHASGEAQRVYGTKDEYLLEQAVYGLPELFRERIRTALLVANPGCYPTASLLAMAPALHLHDPTQAVSVMAISGYSGGGAKYVRKGGWRPYKFAEHRHRGEIAEVAGQLVQRDPLDVTFTPHVNDDIFRGMDAVVELRPKHAVDLPQLQGLYQSKYGDEPFVQVLDREPNPSDVVGTNLCQIMVYVQSGVVKVVSAIDNLGKGASLQAVQNMNLMFGLPETMALQ